MANNKNLKPFKKGNKVAKGHGRPKGSRSFKTVLSDFMEKVITTPKGDMPGIDALCMSMFAKALRGDVSAFREIRDTVEGKPTQTINNNTKLDLSSLNLTSLSDDQLDRLLQDNGTS